MNLTSFNLESFVSKIIIKRPKSLFEPDLEKYHSKLTEEIEGKSVLVIGGAGTIGSAYIQSLVHYAPKSLVVVDTNENELAELVRNLRSSNQYKKIPDLITYPINFGSPLFKKLFKSTAPFDIVANFAAHKHVRTEKDPIAIEAMLTNNIFNNKRLIETLLETPPKHFFCVSTDKAAAPANIMGASKKLMEELLISFSKELNCTTARFANVAFSNGSLLAGFLERIKHNQPISVPKDIKRYFVSIQESGELCLLASVCGKSGEIFFPKLDSIHILSLLEVCDSFLKELGFEPFHVDSEEEARQASSAQIQKTKKYPIYVFQSDTSGEKPYEEFYTSKEKPNLSLFQSIGVISPSLNLDSKSILKKIDRLEKLFQSSTIQKDEIVSLLKELVPTFNHIEMGKHLDQRM